MLLRRNDWADSRLKDRLDNYTSSHESPAGRPVNYCITRNYFYKNGHWDVLITTLAGIVPGATLLRE